MKKGKCKKMHKSIRNTQVKFYCNFPCEEHGLFDELFIRIKYQRKLKRKRNWKKWLKIFDLSFLLKYITELIKAMF